MGHLARFGKDQGSRLCGAEFGSAVVGGSWGMSVYRERKLGLWMKGRQRDEDEVRVALGLEGGQEREEM